jgi:CRP/FNR family transcriptional regulator, cyclic AMP receptor protein
MRAMSITPADLRKLPLFHALGPAHLEALAAVFERAHLPAGEVLFRAGETPSQFLLLVDGEVTLAHDGEPRFRLTPIAPIGELGAITGVRRRTTATTSAPSEIWRVSTHTLLRFFEQRGDVAYPFYHALLGIVADKVRRDEHRMDEMRANLIRTQKAMKRLRDLVLEAEETPVSAKIVESLDVLIEHNRRGHYRVAPKHSFATKIRRDDGELILVSEMNDSELHLPPGAIPAKAGTDWTAVLVLPSGEMPVSGRIERADERGISVRLDPMIDNYAQQLAEHLTRVQMLDVIV